MFHKTILVCLLELLMGFKNLKNDLFTTLISFNKSIFFIKMSGKEKEMNGVKARTFEVVSINTLDLI